MSEPQETQETERGLNNPSDEEIDQEEDNTNKIQAEINNLSPIQPITKVYSKNSGKIMPSQMKQEMMQYSWESLSKYKFKHVGTLAVSDCYAWDAGIWCNHPTFESTNSFERFNRNQRVGIIPQSVIQELVGEMRTHPKYDLTFLLDLPKTEKLQSILIYKNKWCQSLRIICVMLILSGIWTCFNHMNGSRLIFVILSFLIGAVIFVFSCLIQCCINHSKAKNLIFIHFDGEMM